jgi:hypothetical protein
LKQKWERFPKWEPKAVEAFVEERRFSAAQAAYKINMGFSP